jgi:hypothetical protein
MRVVSVTPAGRRRYIEILVPHLLRQRHVINEHHWWLNTNVAEDIGYLQQLCADHPGFFRVCVRPFDASKTHGENIWKFFVDFAQPGTVYVRFDDDIVWMANDAVERIVKSRLEHPQPLLVLGNIVNNANCSAAHQEAGLISKRQGIVQPLCMDWIGWRSGRFARLAHQSFLTDLENGRAARWTDVKIPLACGQRFSINVISWLGETMAALPELAIEQLEEEPLLTEELPLRLGIANLVCNEALFAHFAFYTQRPFMDWTSNDILERYRAIAESRAPRPELLGDFWRKDATWRVTKPLRKLRRGVLKRLGKAA